MEYKESNLLIIAILAVILTIGAFCIATPAMAEGNSLPDVPDQVMSDMSSKDVQDFGVIEIDPDPLAYNESSYNSSNASVDFSASGSVYSGEITGVTITPERLVSNQYATFRVDVKNTGAIQTCYQLEWYSNGVHMTSGFERTIDPGDTETFSWRGTMGSPGDIEYEFDLYWDRVWYLGSNVFLDSATVYRYCYAAGLPDIYEPDDSSSYATVIDTNGEAQYHDFHDSGDGDWVKFYMEPGEVYTVETTTIGDMADTYLTFCYYDGVSWHYIYDDDGGVDLGSKITYTCTRSGYHYAKVRQYSSDVYGETTAYSINVSVEHPSFFVGGHVYLGVAVVSGADVTVIDLNTRGSLTTTTDSNGAYVVNLNNLPSGHSAGDIIQVTATYNGHTGTNSASMSENLSDNPQIIDVTLEPVVSIAIKAADGSDLPESIPVGETFTVLITENGSSVGAGTHVVFTLPYDTGDPVTVSTDDDGKVTYTPLITGTLGIDVLNDVGTTVVSQTVNVIFSPPTLTWQTEPPTSVTQGNDVTFDVSFSEAADYYIRIENSTGGVVWRSPASGTSHAANPAPRTWTTTTATPPGDYTIIININDADNSDTRTVTVTPASVNDTVTRYLPANTGAGAPITVDLTVDVKTGAAYYSIDEIVPSGWTVTSATDGGDYTTTPGHVFWTVTSGAADKTYSYTVEVPAGASGAYTFDGIYAFEGMTGEATILGDTTVTVGDVDTVTRYLPANTSAGASITVNLMVDVETGAAYYSIDETVPSGWTVTSATDGGDYTSETGHVKWVVTSGAIDKTYSYTVEVPAGASGVYTFDGIYMFEGMTGEATSLGDTTLATAEYDSADTNHDCVVSMMELMTQIGKWKSGEVGMMELMTSIGRWKLGAEGYC